jgi:dephospho-CoA kinase
VVEVPLLFESGMDRIFDASIAVIAHEEVRELRAATRAHASLDERLARQLSQQEKAQRATYVVVNDATEAELEAELSGVLEKLQRVSAR